MSISPIQNARRVFEAHGGILRTREALASGIHPRTLYAMRDAGAIDQIARGLFRLADVFKYRNKIGLDVAIEALRTYRSHSPLRFQDIIHYARICLR